jgi:DNA-binding LytR/AlgR family response regulator
MKQSLITFKNREMIIEDSAKISFIEYNSLVCIFFDNPYLILKSIDKSWMLSFSLSQMKEHLPCFFIQCNKSTIINMLFVEYFDKKSRTIQLKGDKRYIVSFRKRNEFEEKLLAIRKNEDSFV